MKMVNNKEIETKIKNLAYFYLGIIIMLLGITLVSSIILLIKIIWQAII